MALDFEKLIEELELKTEELRRFAEQSDIDLSGEIRKMEKKVESLRKEIFSNLTPWQKVSIARLLERPSTLEYIESIFTDFFELHGDRCYGDDLAIIGGIAKFDGIPVTVIGTQKGRDIKENIRRNFASPHPEGYRKALRLMKQAEKFNRPVICFINTQGAYPGIGSEERGQSEAIAKNLFEMSGLKVPIISFIIGEGGSGGALALAVADKVYMLEHSVYSVISPEGFASIVWKDASRASEAADLLKITAQDALNSKIIDGIITEPLGGAHKDINFVANEIKNVIGFEISQLSGKPVNELLDQRYTKYKCIGEFIDK